MLCIKYRLTKSVRCDEEGEKYIVYGVKATGLFGRTIKAFPNVFSDRERAKKFVKLCNDQRLSLIHLGDVVEDAVEEQHCIGV